MTRKRTCPPEFTHLEEKIEDYGKESRRHQESVKASIDKISDEVKSLRSMLERQQTMIENQQSIIDKQHILIEKLTEQSTEFKIQIAPLADLKKAQWFMISTVIAGVILGTIGFFFNK